MAVKGKGDSMDCTARQNSTGIGRSGLSLGHLKRLLVAVVLPILTTAQPAWAAFANGEGIARVPNLGTADDGFGIALQPDGKVLVAGRCLGSGSVNYNPCVARLNADGSLDQGFNATGSVPGKRILDGLQVLTTSIRAVKVLVQADGKIVVATTCRATLAAPSQFCVARLNADGSYDTAFDGPDTANPGNGRFLVPISSGSSNDRLASAALQAIDGRLVLVGQCYEYPCIARLKLADGSFDDSATDFGFVGPAAADRAPGDPGANGRVIYRFPSALNSDGRAESIAVTTTAEGKTLVAGTCAFTGSAYEELCLAKFNRDGTWDADFRGDSLPVGQGGRVRIATTDEQGNFVAQRAADVRTQADGRFLVQCQYKRVNSWRQCLYRVNSGGTIATSFSSGLPFPSEPGRVVYNDSGTALSLALAPPSGSYANRIYALGSCQSANNYDGGPFCVTALRNGTPGGASDGTIDPTLTGPEGDQSGTFFFATRSRTIGFGNAVREIVANEAGEFFVAGECDDRLCVYKFRADGALDTSPCILDVDGDGKVSAASDGRAIVRWMQGAPTPVLIGAGMGYDVDGDGAISATADGVLLLRRMLGFSGAALTSGVTFSTTARRVAPAMIESYLRTRCGQ